MPLLAIEPFTERRLIERYVALLNDPKVVRYSDQRFISHTMESCRAYQESFEGTPNYSWAIVVKGKESEHIGNMNAYLDTNHDVADLAILIGDTNIWGKGHATEAWRTVCDYLFRITGVRKVTAGTIAINTPMVRLMDRTGMMPEGCRLRHNIWEGKEVDMVFAALFKDEWLQKFPAALFQD